MNTQKITIILFLFSLLCNIIYTQEDEEFRECFNDQLYVPLASTGEFNYIHRGAVFSPIDSKENTEIFGGEGGIRWFPFNNDPCVDANYDYYEPPLLPVVEIEDDQGAVTFEEQHILLSYSIDNFAARFADDDINDINGFASLKLDASSDTLSIKMNDFVFTLGDTVLEADTIEPPIINFIVGEQTGISWYFKFIFESNPYTFEINGNVWEIRTFSQRRPLVANGVFDIYDGCCDMPVDVRIKYCPGWNNLGFTSGVACSA
eukprot:TRINITY_DN1859_c0_g1_i2.p1 TRINITY_DN1859_c0_g1~~TRINITY_DN1859_c0_g1_i2.p1  ORF type:complete len:261 (+),score=77.13 TRINITY_DN1859_c0_g1_i2:69-851(+)